MSEDDTTQQGPQDAQEEKAEKPPEPAQPDGELDEEEEEAGIDPRILLFVGAIVLIIIIIYWRQSGPADKAPEPAQQAGTQQAPGGRPAQQAAPRAPQRPPTYPEFIALRRQQAAGFLYRDGGRILAIARPPMPPRKTDKGTVPMSPGAFFDLTKRAKSVLPVDFYRRQARGQVAFRNSFVPIGLPNGSPPRSLNPVFKKASEMQPGELPDEEIVVGVAVGGGVKAYPRKFLRYHDVLNDTVGKTPVVLAYSGVAGTTCAFLRKADNKDLYFGCSSLLYQAANLMYDRGTQSLWSGITGKAVSHRMLGKQLEPLRTTETTWSFWKSQHPGTLAMVDTDPKLGIPYGPDHTVDGDAYHQNTGIMYPVSGFEPGKTLQAKTPVFGVVTPGQAKAYELAYLTKAPKMEDTIGKTAVSITYDPGAGWLQAVTPDGKSFVCRKMYWFAWLGNYPRTQLTAVERAAPVVGAGGRTGTGRAGMGEIGADPDREGAPKKPKKSEQAPAGSGGK